MSCKTRIEEYFDELCKGDIVIANNLYVEKFSDCSEAAFFKTLERMVKSGYLIRVSKGIYSKNNNDAEQMADTVQSQDSILNYYFGENNDNGMYIGYSLYSKYGISRARNTSIELYSNIMTQASKNIGDVHVKRVNIELNYENTRIIEALEILQNYGDIDKFDKIKFAKYAKQFALGYNNESALMVLDNIKYKKGTIAFMKRILDMYEISNTLGKYLSCASKYNVPNIAQV